MPSKLLKVVAGFQMSTGIIMFLGIGYLLFEQNLSNDTPGIEHLFFLILYIVEAYAGRLTWQEKSLGITLSIGIQFLHLITFDILKLAYRFTGVVDFFLYYRHGESPGFDALLGGGRYLINIFDKAHPPMVGINVVALLLLIILVRAKRNKEKSDQTKRQS